jgi:hypothetical protein
VGAIIMVVALVAVPGFSDEYDKAKKWVKTAVTDILKYTGISTVFQALDWTLELIVSRDKIIKGFDWVDKGVSDIFSAVGKGFSDALYYVQTTPIKSAWEKLISNLKNFGPNLIAALTGDKKTKINGTYSFLEMIPKFDINIKLSDKDDIAIETTSKTEESVYTTIIQDYKFQYRLAMLLLFGEVSPHKHIMQEKRTETDNEIRKLSAEIEMWKIKIKAKKALLAARAKAARAAKAAKSALSLGEQLWQIKQLQSI